MKKNKKVKNLSISKMMPMNDHSSEYKKDFLTYLEPQARMLSLKIDRAIKTQLNDWDFGSESENGD